VKTADIAASSCAENKKNYENDKDVNEPPRYTS
jgi:hypothetical protein